MRNWFHKPKACVLRCWKRLLAAHYRTHGSHKHIVAGHTMEFMGGLASLARAEMLAASFITAGAVIVLSVALFAEDHHDTDD